MSRSFRVGCGVGVLGNDFACSRSLSSSPSFLAATNPQPPKLFVRSSLPLRTSIRGPLLTTCSLLQIMAPSKPASAKTGVEGTKKKRGGEKGEFTLKRVKGKSTAPFFTAIV